MTEQCSDCGAELIEGSKFCTTCGKTVEQQPVTPVQPEPQQPVEKKQTPTPPKTKKKPRKKLIMGLLAIVAAAVIVLIIIVYLQSGTNSLGNGNADSRFVGEWEQNNRNGNPRQWIFNSDSTLDINPSIDTMINGTWKVTGNQLCLYNNVVCYTYEFSYNGNMVTLNKIGQNGSYPLNIVLTKKGLQGTSQTPNIECTTDSATNRITIKSIDANVKWSDIEITTNPDIAHWQVQDANKNGLARIGITATITLYVTAGDSIILLDTTGEVTVTLKYVPTNEILGNWAVNV
jgi:hypothetical protein